MSATSVAYVAFTAAINAALLANDQVIANIPEDTIQALVVQGEAIIALLSPSFNSSNYALASACLDTANSISAILSVLQSSNNSQTRILSVVNPNLMALASAYYNDATQWVRIAQANNVTDWLLVGNYTLILPNIPISLTAT